MSDETPLSFSQHVPHLCAHTTFAWITCVPDVPVTDGVRSSLKTALLSRALAVQTWWSADVTANIATNSITHEFY